MFEAFLWGLLAACSLVIGDILATYIHIPRRVLGLVLAFGVGVLMSAISFDLLEDAYLATGRGLSIALGLVGGSLVFFAGDCAIERRGGHSHRRGQSGGTGADILLGSILDGVPESIVIGLTLVKGGAVSVAMIVAVFLANIPEALGATAGLRKTGWSRNRTLLLWLFVTLISGIASFAGYTFFSDVSPDVLAFTMSFAAGALLTMIANSMMPEAYRDSGRIGGLITTCGFGLAYFIGVLW